MTMIKQNHKDNQVSQEIKISFKELKISKHLKEVGFKKQFGVCAGYLFEIVCDTTIMLQFVEKSIPPDDVPCNEYNRNPKVHGCWFWGF